MIYDEKTDMLTFSSGNSVYSFGDNFSIRSGDELDGYTIVSYGSDGGFSVNGDRLSPADMVEVADHMIKRWQRFREYFAADTVPLWKCDVDSAKCENGTMPWCEGCPNQAKE